MATVLALDIATRTGAAWDGDGGRPRVATFVLPAGSGIESMGRRVKAFVAWLHPLGQLIKPDVVAIEAPLVTRGDNVKTNVDTVRLLITLAGVAHYVANTLGCRSIEKNVQSVKRHWAGSGHADKAAMLARCRQLGWQVEDDHQADACALWALVKAELDPAFGYRTTPMFGHAEELERRAAAARGT